MIEKAKFGSSFNEHQKSSFRRPIFRTQLSMPNAEPGVVQGTLDALASKNWKKAIAMSGRECFSVSFAQAISSREQQLYSPGSVFLGCSSSQAQQGTQASPVYDFSCPLPATLPMKSSPSLSSLKSINASVESNVGKGTSNRFRSQKCIPMNELGNCELSVPFDKTRRRASLAVQSTNAAETSEPFSPYAGNTAFYHSVANSSTAQASCTNRGSYLIGTNPQNSSQIFHSPSTHYMLGNCNNNNNSSGYGYSSQLSSANTGIPAPSFPKNRRKAVLTVDAKTTEILIASDSICALFRLKDRSLIGKKLAQVFPVDSSGAVFRKSSTDSKNRFALEDGNARQRRGPLILENNVLFDESQRLRPVYGKPVDVLDAEGNKSTICLWSYPLTSTAAQISQRKCSTILRSPSAYLPSFSSDYSSRNSQLTGSPEIATKTSPTSRQSISIEHSSESSCRANKQSNSSNFSGSSAFHSHFPLTSPSSSSSVYSKVAGANPPSSTSFDLQSAPPQRSKSTCANYSPFLKVLEEEEYQSAQQATPGQIGESNERIVSTTVGEYCAPSTKTDDNCRCEENDRRDNQLGMVESHVYRSQNGDSASGNASTQIEDNAEEDGDGGRKHVKNGYKSTAIIGNHYDDLIDKDSCHSDLRHESGFHPLHKMNNGSARDNDNVESAVKRRWLITMEPINALQMQCILGAKGRIFRTDDSLANILGYNSTNLLFGTEIHRLVPRLKIGTEWDNKTQMCCGCTTKRNGIPFSIVLHSDCDSSGVANSFDLEIRSLSSINGVITITDSGLLYAYNENFLHELVGCEFNYADEKPELDIQELIPDFYDYFPEAQRLQRVNSQKYFSCEDIGNSAAKSLQRSASGSVELNAEEDIGSAGTSTSSTTTNHSRTSSISASSSSTNLSSQVSDKEFPLANVDQERDSNVEFDVDDSSHGKLTTRSATKSRILTSNHHEIVPGTYIGLVKHVDGSLIPVKIEVTVVEIPSNPKLFNVCLGFDRQNDYGFNQSDSCKEEEDSHSGIENSSSSGRLYHATGPALAKMAKFQHPNISYSASNCFPASEDEMHPPAKFSVGGTFGTLRECDSDSAVDFTATKAIADELHSSEAKLQDGMLQDRGLLEDENNDAVRGEYSKFYDTFQLIGNGAFGSVKLAARKDTGLLAVSKFVCKTKVLPESWVQSGKRGNRMIPIEVHLLESLNHANIVKVLDVFENDKYYQLVMEKLGCGMDLFEFIENQHSKLDEPLTSYIYRQVVGAVDYLHENKIVHRDLKDENIIIDQNFSCKLIDFGSAAFFGENIVFSTFCGTLEYCSPEVLTGNKYLGPELELWSLGILLYTLVFFQNPFRNAQEIVQAEIELPWDISEGLFQVLSWLLLPDPKRRATVGEIKRHWWVTQRVDPKQYSFKEILKNCERAQVHPPLYVSDLQNHLKNASSCGNLANVSISAIETPLQESTSGIVSAR